MVPISTAIWDPKWFHDFKGQDHYFFDRRGIINGIRAERLAPGPQLNGMCNGSSGNAIGCSHNPNSCLFLRGYREQLSKVGVDYISDMQKLCSVFVKDAEPIAVLLVHESPTNLCSERIAIQEWIRSHGFECSELAYLI